MNSVRKFNLIFLGSVLLLVFPLYGQQNWEARLKAEISRFFAKRFQVAQEDLRITYLRLPDFSRISDANLTLDCYAPFNLRRLGRQSIWVRFLKDKTLVFKTPVTVEVAVKKTVYVTNENIGYRQRIETQKVTAEDLWLSDTDIYLKAIDAETQWLGKESTHFIPRGKILLTTDVQQPTVVKPGDEVEICVRAGELVVKTKGIARSSGGLGDIVSVKNLMTGKQLKGKVTSPGVVFINYHSRSL